MGQSFSGSIRTFLKFVQMTTGILTERAFKSMSSTRIIQHTKKTNPANCTVRARYAGSASLFPVVLNAGSTAVPLV
jgi:hypothetical protein